MSASGYGVNASHAEDDDETDYYGHVPLEAIRQGLQRSSSATSIKTSASEHIYDADDPRVAGEDFQPNRIDELRYEAEMSGRERRASEIERHHHSGKFPHHDIQFQ